MEPIRAAVAPLPPPHRVQILQAQAAAKGCIGWDAAAQDATNTQAERMMNGSDVRAAD